jgi:dihydroorotase
VDAGRLPLPRAIEALTTGPARVLGERHGVAPGFRQGEPADLVVIDRGATWTVTADTLRSKGTNSPLLGHELRGVVRLTLAGGRVAHAEG